MSFRAVITSSRCAEPSAFRDASGRTTSEGSARSELSLRPAADQRRSAV